MSTVQPTTRLWTRAEYHRMADLGLFEGERVELIEGEIVQMPAQKSLHAISLGLATNSLQEAFGNGHWLRSQMPLRIGTRSEPEPDLAVVPGEPRDYTVHPSTALLVVEVSDTSLAFDRLRKATLYAKGGILDYWIINLVARQLEIHRSPMRNPEGRGWVFSETSILLPHEFARPLSKPRARISVAGLLP